jgi:hypothetical protein
MPETVRALFAARAEFEARARPPTHPLDEDTLIALDHLAAHLVAALARFVDEPIALLPAQRALSLLGGRRDEGRIDLSGALLAMRDLDDGKSAAGRGFSRLLESALDASGRVVVERLHVGDLPDDLASLAQLLDGHGRILSAVDDLAHALSVSSEQAAGVVVTEALLHLVLPSHDDALDFGLQWLRHRRVKAPLLRLFVLRHAVDHIDDEDVALAVDAGVARGLALWIVAERAVRGVSLVNDDQAALTALFERAGLAPFEVLDAADLLSDLQRRS